MKRVFFAAGSDEMLEYLLQKGAPVNLPSALGETPIDIAIRMGTRAKIVMLMEYGAITL